MGGIDWLSRIGYGVDPVRRGRTDVIGSAGRGFLLLAQERLTQWPASYRTRLVTRRVPVPCNRTVAVHDY